MASDTKCDVPGRVDDVNNPRDASRLCLCPGRKRRIRLNVSNRIAWAFDGSRLIIVPRRERLLRSAKQVAPILLFSIAIRRAFTLAFKTDIKDSRDEHELHEGSCRSRVRVEIRSRRAPRHRVMSRSQRYAAIMPESPSSATSHSLRVGYGRITNARENTAALPIMAAQTRFSLASGVGFLLHRETAALTTNSITRAPAPISDSLSLALSTSARPEPRERLGFF
jgi:hypothetical protein